MAIDALQHVQPMSGALLEALPACIVTGLALVVWFYCCRAIYRKNDPEHRKADRLWRRTLATLGILGVFTMIAFALDITPATSAEREFIALVIQTGNDIPDARPKVKALQTTMQNDFYVSKQYFTMAVRISESF